MTAFSDYLKEKKKECVKYGSDVSSGTYECADCGYIYSNQAKTSLPPCPELDNKPHSKHCWNILTGQGDAPNDPYPDK